MVLFLQNIKEWRKCVFTSTRYYYLRKSYFIQYSGFFQGVFTLIINIEGKYLLFLVHFWHQTFIFLVPVISILTLDICQSIILFHLLLFHNSEFGQEMNIFNPLLVLPHLKKN